MFRASGSNNKNKGGKKEFDVRNEERNRESEIERRVK